jgi:hypothetical protein
MSWNSRLCRQCGARFNPARIDARLCRACDSHEVALAIVVEYLVAHPDAELTRLSLATGVSEEVIASFARAGALPSIPSGGGRTCMCPPDQPGSCLACRGRWAAMFDTAADDLKSGASRTGARPHGGMRTRPKD